MESEIGYIPDNWNISTIAEESEFVTDYVANGSFASLKENVKYKSSPDYAVLIRLVDYSNNFNGNFVYVDKHSYDFLKKSKLLGGEIIISNVGEYAGTVFRTPKLGVPMTLGPNAIMMNFKNSNDFYYYWFISPIGKYYLDSIRTGSAHPKFNKTDFRQLKIPVPPTQEQRAIAGVLSSLDDKIDLLHRQNKTLEGMTEALWRKIFVEEADPGWSKGKLGDIVELNPLRPIKKGTIATYLDMSNMPTNGPFPTEWIQREFSSGMKFKNSDTIIARITPCLENGKTAYVNFLGEGEIGWGSTEYVILTPKPGYCPEWNYFLARNDDFRDFAIQNMTGTSGRQRVSGDSIAQYEIAIAPMNIFEKFKTFAGPVMEHIKYNSIQIRTLSRLRDTLLPKLMSGEVRVKL